MSWLVVFGGLCLLIMLHEAGHYVAAKATGMRVERFFLFFGPTIWSFKRGETEYGVKAIPLGGYVKITGMNPEEEIPPGVAHRAYYRQKVWKRIVVIVAGPAVNVVLAFAILCVVAFSYPEPTSKIEKVEPHSPAAVAGVMPGVRLISVDGKRFAADNSEERLERFGKLIASHKCADNKPIEGCRASTAVQLGVEQSGRLRIVSAYPVYDPTAGHTRVGIEYGSRPAAANIEEAGSFASKKMWEVASGTFHILSRILQPEERKQISGLVGISNVGHQAVNVGPTPALLLLALVSLSLGLINLLPILPLDGGHIFWSLVEKLRGSPASLRTMERASVVGLILVMALFVIGLNNDIGRLTH
jgi:regulator of sigma E protease